MGMYSNAYLSVSCFTGEAKNKVKSIDLSGHNLDDWKENWKNGLYCRTENLAYGRNDFRGLMSKIGDALGPDGKAYIAELCMEDVPEGTVYFYLGEKVRYRKFDEYDFDEYQETFEWPDCEDDVFIPSPDWDPSHVIFQDRKQKFTDTEKDILGK